MLRAEHSGVQDKPLKQGLTRLCDFVEAFPVRFVPIVHQFQGVLQGPDFLLGLPDLGIQIISLSLELLLLLSSLITTDPDQQD